MLQVPQSSLDLNGVKSILSEYRIHNTDITLRCDATADDIIDIVEGNRCVLCISSLLYFESGVLNCHLYTQCVCFSVCVLVCLYVCLSVYLCLCRACNKDRKVLGLVSAQDVIVLKLIKTDLTLVEIYTVALDFGSDMCQIIVGNT